MEPNLVQAFTDLMRLAQSGADEKTLAAALIYYANHSGPVTLAHLMKEVHVVGNPYD